MTGAAYYHHYRHGLSLCSLVPVLLVMHDGASPTSTRETLEVRVNEVGIMGLGLRLASLTLARRPGIGKTPLTRLGTASRQSLFASRDNKRHSAPSNQKKSLLSSSSSSSRY